MSPFEVATVLRAWKSDFLDGPDRAHSGGYATANARAPSAPAVIRGQQSRSKQRHPEADVYEPPGRRAGIESSYVYDRHPPRRRVDSDAGSLEQDVPPARHKKANGGSSRAGSEGALGRRKHGANATGWCNDVAGSGALQHTEDGGYVNWGLGYGAPPPPLPDLRGQALPDRHSPSGSVPATPPRDTRHHRGHNGDAVASPHTPQQEHMPVREAWSETRSGGRHDKVRNPAQNRSAYHHRGRDGDVVSAPRTPPQEPTPFREAWSETRNGGRHDKVRNPAHVRELFDPRDSPMGARHLHQPRSPAPLLQDAELVCEPTAEAAHPQRRVGDERWGEGGMSSLISISSPCAIAISVDGGSVYVVGREGLVRYRLPSFEQLSDAAYAGRHTTAPGYSDVVAGPDSIVCADLEGTLYDHDPSTCELRLERPYQPSVVESGQRLVASRVQSFKRPIVGLHGGFGGAARLVLSREAVYLGGRDGVVTVYTLNNLNVIARTRLSEGPEPPGIRVLHLGASSQRLYCGALSTVHALSTPSLAVEAKLYGGPRVPIFGRVCGIVEGVGGHLLFTSDTGGPSIHLWDTARWEWLCRVELAQGGGAACYLAATFGHEAGRDVSHLLAATDTGRLLAFRLGRLPPLLIEEGGGGGPMATSPMSPDLVVILEQQAGCLALRRCSGPS